MDYGISDMRVNNRHILRNLYRVIILDIDYGNALLACDFLKHGTVVIIIGNADKFIFGAPANAPFVVTSAAEAISLAFRLHEDSQMWAAASQAGKACA